MLKSKLRILRRKLLLLSIISFIILGIGIGFAFFLTCKVHYDLLNVLSSEGMILLIIGILLSMKGNPSGMNVQGIGLSSGNIHCYINNEYTRMERDITQYNKNFLKHSIIEITLWNLAFVFDGILLMMISFLIAKHN